MRDTRYKVIDPRSLILIIFLLLTIDEFPARLTFKLPILTQGSTRLSTVLWAQETKTEEPVLITSDKVEYFDKKKEGEFVGNVKATQGKLLLTASRLRVILEADGKKIQQIVATGSVKMVQEDLTATSEQAIFYNEEQKVVLTGKPHALSRNNRFSGEKITVYLKENRIIIETKVKGIIVQE